MIILQLHKKCEYKITQIFSNKDRNLQKLLIYTVFYVFKVLKFLRWVLYDKDMYFLYRPFLVLFVSNHEFIIGDGGDGG